MFIYFKLFKLLIIDLFKQFSYIINPNRYGIVTLRVVPNSSQFNQNIAVILDESDFEGLDDPHRDLYQLDVVFTKRVVCE